MIAAYGDPCVVFSLMMIPALDHGCTPEVHPAVPAVVIVRPFGPEVWEAHELRPRNANPAGSTAARSRPMSQPRMVRSFVHSARTVWPKRPRLSAPSD